MTIWPDSRLAELRLRHQHAVRDARVVGREVGDAGLDLQPPHDFARATLQDLDDRALRLAPEARALDAHGDAVAVDHLAHLLRTAGRSRPRRRRAAATRRRCAAPGRCRRRGPAAVRAGSTGRDGSARASPRFTSAASCASASAPATGPERLDDLVEPQRAAGAPQALEDAGLGRRRRARRGGATVAAPRGGWLERRLRFLCIRIREGGIVPPVFVDSPGGRQ